MSQNGGKRWPAALLALMLGVGALLPAAPVAASEKTWRYLTYGGAGLTAYGLAKKKSGLAILGAAGTAYSYSRWKKDVRNRHRRQRAGRQTRHSRYYRHVYYRR